MNTPAKKEHPTWMSEDDISIYDQLLSMGKTQIGKEIGKNEEYLLDLSAMITLKQMKGMLVDIDDPAIAVLKRIHKEHFEAGLIHTTPADEWYMSARVLREPYLDPAVEKEIDYANALVGVDTSLAITSNLIVKSCDADELVVEDGVAKIKEGWVKLAIAEPS